MSGGIWTELELEIPVDSNEFEETQRLLESRELGETADIMRHSTFNR